MKKNCIIIGAGSVGGFVVHNFEPLSDEYELIGFLDDDEQKLNKLIFGKKVLGKISEINKYLDCHFILGIAFPKIKDNIIRNILHLNPTFLTYISPEAWISNSVSIGEGVIIYPGATINYETVVGNFVTINMNCTVGHNCILSDFTTLAPSVSLAGHTNCEKGVDMGIGSSTRQNARIGEFAIVGGQAMVINDIEKNSVVGGIPAKTLKCNK